MIGCSFDEQFNPHMRFEGTDDDLNVGRLSVDVTFVDAFDCLSSVRGRNHLKAWWDVPFAQRAAPMRNMILARCLRSPMKDS